MSDSKIRRALISVYDKTGIVAFAQGLLELGIEIISTGGTAALLKDSGVAVTLVEEVTGFPEMLDGRVKTLHPKIHAAILADRDNPQHMRQLAEQGIEPIDMVVVNLYPFEKTIADPDCTFEQAIEMIDIGGPCLLRAAAKNHKHVLVVSDPGRYEDLLRELASANHLFEIGGQLRQAAGGAFQTTMLYDSAIASWLGNDPADRLPEERVVRLLSRGALRYGENPHQRGEILKLADIDRKPDFTEMLDLRGESGPKLSFNNLVDATAAIDLCEDLHRELPRTHAAVIVKHTSACGAAAAGDSVEAYRSAYLGDPQAAMGGVLAVNFKVTAEFTEMVMDSLARWGKAAGAGAFFLEVWLAPSFEEDAVACIESRKNWGKRVRLLDVGEIPATACETEMEIKRVPGGVLLQGRDMVGLNEEQWQLVTRRQPTDSELHDLRLAWLVAKHTKSNAISICKDGMLIGNGAGQMSRVMSCRIATWLANENGHADKLAGAVAASDGFFPFPDGPDLLQTAGVSAIIQPGGSQRDQEVIDACNEHDMAMIFTGTRHFKH